MDLGIHPVPVLGDVDSVTGIFTTTDITSQLSEA
jgi:hypothetical protein